MENLIFDVRGGGGVARSATPGDRSNRSGMLGRAAKQALLALWLLMPMTAFAAVSSENFDGITAQIVSNKSSVTFHGWTYGYRTIPSQTAVAGYANGGTFTYGLTNDYVADRGIFLNYNATGENQIYFRSTDWSNFKLDSFQMGHMVGSAYIGTITIYADGSPVGSAPFDLSHSSSANGITYTFGGVDLKGTNYGTFTFNSWYSNVDEVDFTFTAKASPILDNINVSAAIAPIPTLTDWSRMLLLALMGLMGVFYVWRRNAPSKG